MSRYAVQYLHVSDLDAVHEIDLASFPVPWQRDTYINQLRAGHDNRFVAARFALTPASPAFQPSQQRTFRQRLAAQVAAHTDSMSKSPAAAPLLVGYGGICRQGKTGHIATVAVHPAHRGKGVATLLLLALMEEAYALRVHRVALEARVSNTPALRLYDAFGFTATGIHSGYYSDNNEDAVLMSIEAIGAIAVRERLKRINDALFVRWQNAETPPETAQR